MTDSNTIELQGRSLRAFIIEKQQEEAKELILNLGVNTSLDIRVTPIVLACIHENIELLTFCLENGGDVNAAYAPLSEDSCSLLSFACRVGNTMLAKLLLDKGADPNWQNKAGKSVLEELLDGDRDEKKTILVLLLNAAADPNTKMTFNEGQPFYEAISDWGSALVEVVDDFNSTEE